MNARGRSTLTKTWHALTASADHDGRVRDLSLPQLARRVGVTQRHMQSLMATLEAMGRFTRDVRRGFTNRYRLLVAWTRAMIAGESRAADRQPAAAEPSAAPSPRPFVYANLDHHPNL